MKERSKILYLFDISFLGFKHTLNVKDVNKCQPEENAGSITASSNSGGTFLWPSFLFI